jgi:hypothetical protein
MCDPYCSETLAWRRHNIDHPSFLKPTPQSGSCRAHRHTLYAYMYTRSYKHKQLPQSNASRAQYRQHLGFAVLASQRGGRVASLVSQCDIGAVCQQQGTHLPEERTDTHTHTSTGRMSDDGLHTPHQYTPFIKHLAECAPDHDQTWQRRAAACRPFGLGR